MNTYRVKKVFGPTLQGEGTHVGRVVYFVRFAGCNRWTGLEKDREKSFCKFCDTDFRGGEPMTLLGILSALAALPGRPNNRRVVLSGGEPTLQLDRDLLHGFHKHSYEVHVETNGSQDISTLEPWIDHVTVSPKQPRRLTNLARAHALKLLYPLTDPEMSPDKWLGFNAREFFLQPVMDANYAENVKATVKYCTENPLWRLSLQTHKILEVE